MGSKLSSGDSDVESLSDINVTPFVDVALVLLVVFMITAPILVKNSIRVQLPKSSQGTSLNPKSLGLAVTRQGQMILDGQLMSDDALLARLKDEVSRDPKIQIAISADAESIHQSFVNAVDLCKRGGVENFAIEVQKRK